VDKIVVAVKAMILAAGEGTRLRPLTLDRPKPMLPLGGKPLLEHLLRWLHSYGVCQIAINLHHQPEAITSHFGDGHRFGVSITYSYEEQLLGTAGAVKRVQSFFDETFVVVYGDVFTNLDLSRLIHFHNAHREEGMRDGTAGAAVGSPDPFLTLALYRVDNPSSCGLAEVDDRGRVTRFVEKPSPEEVFTNMANAGVVVLEPGVLEHIPPATFCDFGRDLFPRLLERAIPLYGCPLRDGEFLIDIGTPASYRRAQERYREGTGCSQPPDGGRGGCSPALSYPKPLPLPHSPECSSPLQARHPCAGGLGSPPLT
jgi:NDP-sugar pyrophosphorylase family protein